MDLDLYIWLLAGVSLIGYLLYPAQSTWAASALTGTCVNGICTNSFSMDAIINNIVGYVSNNAAIILGLGSLFAGAFVASILTGVSLSSFGLIALFQILWRISVFFLIPNLFFLPNNLIGSSDLPNEVKIVIFFIFNVLLLTIAVRYWE